MEGYIPKRYWSREPITHAPQTFSDDASQSFKTATFPAIVPEKFLPTTKTSQIATMNSLWIYPRMGCPKLQWFFTGFRHSHPFSMVTFFPPGPAAMQRRLWDLSQTPARRRTTISAIIGLNLGHIRHAKHAMEEPASPDPALSKCDPLSFSPRHPPAHYEARPLSFQALKTTSPGPPLH